MPADFEQMLKEVFGESISKVSQFQSEQMKKLNGKLQELAREALKDDISKLHAEIHDLRTRIATLESERAQKAAEGLESSF